MLNTLLTANYRSVVHHNWNNSFLANEGFSSFQYTNLDTVTFDTLNVGGSDAVVKFGKTDDGPN